MTSIRIRTVSAIAIAALLALTPLALPMFGATFWINVIAEILIWSLLAMSVNLLFGYVGLLSFGQALYFGFGMYGAAIGITQFGLGLWGAMLLGVTAATAMAAVAGAFAVRLTWHYFAIITVVFSLIFYFTAMSAKSLTGGDDGLSFTAPPILAAAGLMLTWSASHATLAWRSWSRARWACVSQPSATTRTGLLSSASTSISRDGLRLSSQASSPA